MATYDYIPGMDTNFNMLPEVNKQLGVNLLADPNFVKNFAPGFVEMKSGSLDDLKTPGDYYITSTAVTSRPNAYYCTVSVRSAAGGRVIHEATTTEDSPKTFRRVFSSGVWKPWSLSGASVNVTSVTSGSMNDLVKTGSYTIDNAAVTERPNAYYCTLDVTEAVGGRVIQEAKTIEDPPKIFVRRSHGGVWSSWTNLNEPVSFDTRNFKMAEGFVKKDLLRQNLSARKGGVIGTNGKAAVALRFDDAPQPFFEKVLPILQKYGLPFTRVSTSVSIHGEILPQSIWLDMQNYCIESGGEVWNHGKTHKDATGNDSMDSEILGALNTLRENMPRLSIDCFAPPGGGVKYDGAMSNTSISNHAETYAGQMIYTNHAIVSGYFDNTYYRQLDGIVRDGQTHYSCDPYDYTKCIGFVNRSVEYGTGIVLMYHPNNLDTASGIALTEFEKIMAEIARLRDTGSIEVLTLSGLSHADKYSSRRNDLLKGTASGSTFTETITYLQLRHDTRGSTRVLTADVTGSQGTSVTSSIGGVAREWVIPSSGTLKLNHPYTIPTDINTLSVSISGGTISNAHLYAV